MILNLNGIIHGKRIDLEKDIGLPPGTQVTVQLESNPVSVADFKNSILQLCGAWQDESLDSIFEEILKERETRPVRSVPDFDAPS